MNWPEVVIFTFSYSKWLRTCQTRSFLVKVYWNTPWTEQKCCYSLTISQSDVNICCTCMFSYNVYDSPGTYDGLYGLYASILIIIWNFIIFLLLHFPMSQVSFLICLTCGVKCKLCQATYLVLLFSSHQYLEMSLHYRVLCAFVIFFKSLWLFFIHTLKKIWDFDCLSV